ncbi:MAG: hypothetical protein K9G62_04450 [Alphaproteobacteria bacterium]|nr:hypothetical protein [Alphaproteobacteria bacterium]
MLKLETALAAVRVGDYSKAEKILWDFLEGKFSLEIEDLHIRKDNISLNSVNGIFSDKAEKKYFFKFHLEENESETVKEYYRADLLARVGYPVEQPLYVSHEPGEQILVYPYVEHERLFDACQRLEHSPDSAPIVHAQAEMDKLCVNKCVETLSMGTAEDLEKEAILQLFYWRLVDKTPEGDIPGGRHHRFYVGQDFQFPGLKLSYNELADLKWNINGVDYDMTLQEAFEKARTLLSPHNAAPYPACIAHGDDHNGNVWVRKDGSLSWFDPAFAGEKIPALLAGVKPLFHNILAHPDWLYNPQEADRILVVTAKIQNGSLHVNHNWKLSPLRNFFLKSKIENYWVPLLKNLKAQGVLDNGWEEYVRSALFCCPTLVINLRADSGTAQNSHTPQTSLLGLSIAMMCATPPKDGEDVVSRFFDAITPE